LEERNRLAARIHDEIGHGMSGSILLLEGANLIMDKEPEKARETIAGVTENLRESVDKIRAMLREERTTGAFVSLARIENELNAFSSKHPNIKTSFEKEGDMDEINGTVWTCIYENMLEALTNMLKHSAATLFSVRIKNNADLLLVEFSDNGRKAKPDNAARTEEVRKEGKEEGKQEEDRNPTEGRLIKEIKPGIGLQNMEERAALCYGRCFFRYEEDGFHVIMTFPRRGVI
jgi:signal transduction histidine kinase